MQLKSSKTSKHGMVATSQPLAAEVGKKILAQGGNAVDAAIATAVALTIVEPTSNGIGGDVFAQVWINEELHGLNSSSIAPEKMTLSEMHKRGHTEEVPKLGWLPVTVPGAPAAWQALSERWGKLPLAEVMAPAIALARDGFEVSPTVAILWQQEFQKFEEYLKDTEHWDNWKNTYTIDGKAPEAGQIKTFPDHANTLEELASTQCKSFYTGKLADAIDQHSRAGDGLLRKSDLEQYSPEWVTPISTNYRGYDIWEIPPNGQGLVVLMALNMLKGYEFSNDAREEVATLHKQIEVLKLAYTDGQAHITQLDKMKASVSDMLSESYANQRRSLIDENACMPSAGDPSSGGTVYLATADSEGNMVSFIQSNFYGIGSGIVVPNTGIALNNRGHDFSLDPNHPNCLEHGKRMFHTIIPGFISKQVGEGVDKKMEAIGPFGVMGAYMQPQGQLQVLMNMIDFNMEPQVALDAARWQWFGGKTIGIEKEFSTAVFDGLKALGHDIDWAKDPTIYGRGQVILKDQENQQYIGGTEKRCDGFIATL